MGLKDYRKYKREQELKESETISLLFQEIERLNMEVAQLKEERTVFVKANNLTEEEKKTIQQIHEAKGKPEDVIKLFTNDLQEFDPNA